MEITPAQGTMLTCVYVETVYEFPNEPEVTPTCKLEFQVLPTMGNRNLLVIGQGCKVSWR